MGSRKALLPLFLIFAISGCAALPLSSSYKGPAQRPESLNAYYDHSGGYTDFEEFPLITETNRTIKRIALKSSHGEIVIDYFQGNEASKDLIIVFPVLGGSNVIANHFANYFSETGYDTAVIHRNEDFKNPENFPKIEEMLRSNIIRDRIALDFFENRYDKENFGSFGISRGAINVAMTASVDSRLKYNVLALAGEDIPGLFKRSNQRRFPEYRKAVMEKRGISEDEFYTELRAQIKSDPKHLSSYMDARNTLLILGMFDQTVPFRYGMRLREGMGGPKTLLLPATHATGLLFTQMVHLVPPTPVTMFPFDYIETEARAFYDEKFDRQSIAAAKLLPFKILAAPFSLIANIVDAIRGK